MRFAFFLTAGLVAFAAAAAGCESDDPQTSDDPSPPAVASHPPGSDLPPGVEERGPTSRPAASDQYGNWQVLEIGGVSVEIPLSERWRVQIILDPCFGDGRYYILLENRDTLDRIRVDMVNPRVSSVAADPPKLEAMTERILRTVKGSHTPPVALQTSGPNPTMTTCAGEHPDEVPTLIVDSFTPPPSAQQTPTIATTTPPRSDEAGAQDEEVTP